jgi:IS30 family transposase
LRPWSRSRRHLRAPETTQGCPDNRAGDLPQVNRRFSVDTGVEVYFCDPRSPWQRGSNENTNGLLRQYFPKRESLAGVTQEQLDEVAAKLNRRPRKTLGFATPAEKLADLIDGLEEAGAER